MRIPKNLFGESPRRIAVGLASAAVILSFVACSSSDDDSDGSDVVDSVDGVDVVDGDADGDGFLDDGIISATLPFQNRAFEAEDGGLEIATAYGDRTTCLLYTSPSPRDLSTSRMPSSA